MKAREKGSENVDLLHKKVRDFLKQGRTEPAIIDELKKEGINSDYAKIIIANVLDDIYDKKSFWKLIFGGLFFIIGGLAINYFSYQIAVTAGSFFFYIFWGVVVAGILMIVRAFTIFKK